MSFNSPLDEPKPTPSSVSDTTSDNSIPAYGSSPDVTPTGKTSIMSIIGLVLAVITPLIGLIWSIVAFRQADETGDNKKVAKIGIIVGSVLTVVTIIYYIWVFCAMGSATIHGTH